MTFLRQLTEVLQSLESDGVFESDKHALYHAIRLGKRDSKLESRVIRNPHFAFSYALNILGLKPSHIS